MFRYGKLGTRLVAVSLALSVPPFAVLGLLAINHSRTAVQQGVGDHLASLALKRSHAVSRWIQERKNDLGQMSDPCLLDPGHEDEIGPWLLRVQEEQPYYHGIFAVNQSGRTVFSTSSERDPEDHSDQQYFKHAMAGETWASDAYWDTGLGAPAMMLAAPIPHHNEIDGAIVARVDLSEIEEIVTAVRPGRTGEAFVIDSRGRMITDSRFRHNAALRESVRVPEIEGLFAEKRLSARHAPDYRGERTLTVYSSIPDQRWALVVKQDTDEAYTAARQLTIWWGAGLLAGLIAVTVVSLLVARTVSAPLAELVASARRIGRGDLEHRTATEAADEVGELAGAFNEMVERLQASQRSLKQNQEQLAAAKTKLQALYTMDHRQLESLHEVTTAVSSTLDLEGVLRTVLQKVVTHLDASHGAIRLTDEVSISPDTGTSALRTVRGSDNAVTPAVLEDVERRLVRQVVETREPLLIPQENAGVATGPDIPNCSAMFAPLAAADECQGAIHVARTGEGKPPFQQDDLRFLSAVARQAAIAIQNARLYQAERKHRRELERARVRLDGLLDQVLTAQEQERRRVALELHDGPSQSMAATLRCLELCEALLDGGEARVRRELQGLQTRVQGDLSEMRRLINDMRPTLLDSLGFLAAARQYCREFQEESGVSTALKVTGRDYGLGGRESATLFRVLQEALTNVRKHAEARGVLVEVECAADRLRMTVADDGEGLSVPQNGEGSLSDRQFGLLGMRERAELLGGRLHVESSAEMGTAVTIEIPLVEVSPDDSGGTAGDDELRQDPHHGG